MNYVKPELNLLGKAVNVIQLTAKPVGSFDVDDPNRPISTAYDLDE